MEKCLTPEFRVSFPAVFAPRAFDDSQEPKYEVTMLFPKTADLSKMKALAKSAVEAKWPDKDKRPKLKNNPFRDGDTERPDMDGYTGHIFIKATSKKKPGVVDQQRDPIIAVEDFYAGCYAHATLTCYCYDFRGNCGVAFGLQNIQKLRDGDEFSGRSKPEDDFDIVDGPDLPAGEAGASVEEDLFG